MKKARSGNPRDLFPPLKNEDGKSLCRKCGKELSGRRSSWCSDECHLEAMIICYPSFARAAVERRDKGICSSCGRDTVKLRRRLMRYVGNLRKRKLYKMAEGLIKRWRSKGWPVDYYFSRSWWDAHHSIPVVEGGGGVGLDGYETQCCLCHKAETAALAKRRALCRSPQKQLFPS